MRKRTACEGSTLFFRVEESFKAIEKRGNLFK